MAQFRKKPVVIDAVQWDGTLEAFGAIGALSPGNHVEPNGNETLSIPTLEGTMTASLNDWIIRGVRGELYPCKPEIFADTYDRAEEPKPDAEGSYSDLSSHDSHCLCLRCVAAVPSADQLERLRAASPFKGATCRGSYVLGTACGHCERCAYDPANPANIKRLADAEKPIGLTPAPMYDSVVGLREHIMQFFSWAHLPPHLQETSRPFADLANWIQAEIPANPERDAGLRKILEAKDCIVRARLAK